MLFCFVSVLCAAVIFQLAACRSGAKAGLAFDLTAEKEAYPALARVAGKSAGVLLHDNHPGQSSPMFVSIVLAHLSDTGQSGGSNQAAIESDGISKVRQSGTRGRWSSSSTAAPRLQVCAFLTPSTGTKRYIHFWTTCSYPFLVMSNTRIEQEQIFNSTL